MNVDVRNEGELDEVTLLTLINAGIYRQAVACIENTLPDRM